MLFGLLCCEKEDNIKFYLDSIDSDMYYSEEIIPVEHQIVYGKWKLFQVSGGFHGTGYEPDYEYLEIKSSGIYGLIRNNNLFEYGKLEIDTFDTFSPDILQININSDYHNGLNPYYTNSRFYLFYDKQDTLNMNTANPDGYSYHYKRIK